MHRPVLLWFLYTGQRAKIPDSPVKYRTPGKWQPYLGETKDP